MLVKHKVNLLCNLLSVLTNFQVDAAKHLEKSLENSSEAETWFWWNSNLMCRWLGALLTPPFECFSPPEGQKLPKHDKNQ